ncbi:MAG: hypothetical protein KIT84_33215 [Labilithrix sp.]|nr:hypothetical protein [Labilithrix sp.]MCW5815907.1 hypothetical protein [Labilithrix sp.]
MRIFALVLLLVAAACNKTKEGAPCKGNEQACAADKASGLVCRNGTFVSVACAGPLKCAKYEDHINCDTSIASAGATCMGEDDEHACTADKKQALACKGGRFEKLADCRGPDGCSMLGRTPACDASVAVKDDACNKDGALACTEDKKQMLACRSGKFVLHRQCRGEHGCITKPEGPSCDESISEVGDPCGVAGMVVCSTDGKTELVCQGNRYTKTRTCKTSCTISTRPGRPIDCK